MWYQHYYGIGEGKFESKLHCRRNLESFCMFSTGEDSLGLRQRALSNNSITCLPLTHPIPHPILGVVTNTKQIQ